MSISPPTASTPATAAEREIRIISHSNLFYWWPVWAIGLLMALLTWWDGHLMAIVPPGATAEILKIDGNDVEVIVVKDDKGQFKKLARDKDKELVQPRFHMTLSRSLGVVYAIVLLLVIVITNVPLRGLWSVIVIVVIVLGTIIFWLADWWETIFRLLGRLSIYINMGGYLFISVTLFVAWLLTFWLFDRQVYMIFTSGQLRVHTEIGGGEIAYDTMGMTVQKQRSDLFRHWVLGLGSGDLIVKTSGAQAHHFDLPNVLFIGRKVKQIEDMLRERPVVRGN